MEDNTFKHSARRQHVAKYKPLYKQWWFMLLIVFVLLCTAGSALIYKNYFSDIKSDKSATQEKDQNVNVKEDPNAPTDYKKALARAKSYSNAMHMSKKGIYGQLTSQAGDKYSKEAAQYAIDHLNVDYKKNALRTAEFYKKNMKMDKKIISSQLTSDYGGKFTKEEADWAMANLK